MGFFCLPGAVRQILPHVCSLCTRQIYQYPANRVFKTCYVAGFSHIAFVIFEYFWERTGRFFAAKQNKSIVPINHLVEPTRLAAKARYRLWFLWTEFKLKLAMGEMDLEGLWKHALQPLLLSVMCLLWCLLSFFYFDGLCFVTQLVRYVLVSVLALFISSLLLSVRFFSAFSFFCTFTFFYICTSYLGVQDFFQCYYIFNFEKK